MQDQEQTADSSQLAPSPAEPVIDDVGKSTKSYIWKNDKTLVIIYAFLVVASIAAVVRTGVPHFIVIPIIIGAIGYGHVQSKIKREFTQQFGASIGFALTVSGKGATITGADAFINPNPR